MPNPTIKNISRTKISDEAGMNKALVTISFDVPVQAYTFNVLGVSHDTGTVADSSSRFIQDIKSQKVSDVKLRNVRDIRLIEGDIVADIDFTELYQEGNNRINIYGKGIREHAIFTEEWDTQPYVLSNTTLNSVSNSILNVTSLTTDPMINMFDLGSFNPNIYRYFKIKYRVINGNSNGTEFFYKTETVSSLSETYSVKGNNAYINDGEWHITFIDCWTNPEWRINGNITGWRFDWCRASGVNMEFDYIKLVIDMDDETWTPYEN